MSPRQRRLLFIVAIVVLAGLLREWAVRRLPVDFDEPVYGRAAQTYAAAIRAGETVHLADDDPSPEHPGLVKLLTAAVFLRYPPLPDELTRGDMIEAGLAEWAADPANLPWMAQMQAMLRAARRLSAVFGALHVLLLAAVSPAAGALLAVHSYSVKYTAQAYLEAVPMFTATVCVLAYMGALKRNAKAQRGKDAKEEENNSSFASLPLSVFAFNSSRLSVFALISLWTLSAVALGLTAAGKYLYAVAGLAVAADYVWRMAEARRPRGLLVLLGWGALALLVFYAANPLLWPDPAGRLFDSLAFHAAYSQGAHVAQSGYPWYQPFVWLLAPLPVTWHPGVIVTPLDTLTALLGAAGLRAMWRRWDGRGRVVVLWWGIGLLFLLLWSTKWPQYSLIMTAPMGLCAGEALRTILGRLRGS